MAFKTTLVLNHPLCRIILDQNKGGLGEHQVLIRMKNGEWLEHEPFPGDLKGCVNALDLAMNVISGKFYPRGLANKEPMNVPQLVAGKKDGAESY